MRRQREARGEHKNVNRRSGRGARHSNANGVELKLIVQNPRVQRGGRLCIQLSCVALRHTRHRIDKESTNLPLSNHHPQTPPTHLLLPTPPTTHARNPTSTRPTRLQPKEFGFPMPPPNPDCPGIATSFPAPEQFYSTAPEVGKGLRRGRIPESRESECRKEKQ